MYYQRLKSQVPTLVGTRLGTRNLNIVNNFVSLLLRQFLVENKQIVVFLYMLQIFI